MITLLLLNFVKIEIRRGRLETNRWFDIGKWRKHVRGSFLKSSNRKILEFWK